jgi:transglutaminase-like putative cysteine protease
MSITLALPSRRLQWLAQAFLVAACVGLDVGWLLGALTLALVLMAGLKLLEARNRQGRRLVALLQVVSCGLIAAQQPDLLPSIVQLGATVLALAGLLQLETGQALAWRPLLRRSLRLLAAALPMALALFLLVPRIGPFGPGIGGPGARADTGLSDSLDPGSIAALVNDPAPAARVAFSTNQPPPPQERYWRVLVHPLFTGATWERHPLAESDRPAPPLPAPTGGPFADQVWLVEPSRFRAVPWDGKAQPLDAALRPEASGELRLLRPALGRRSYRLLEQAQPLGWQRQLPRGYELSLPGGANPRLLELGRSWAALPDPALRVEAARRFFTSQGFRYTTTPGRLPDRDGLDVFLFEQRQGFCGHYASAFSALMRAAGVPSRVVSGYLGGRWVEPLGGNSFLELRQLDAHAWSEVWLPAAGWQRVDPTRWLPGATTASAGPAAREERSRWPLARQGRWLREQWWGLDVAWSRWWLGFDRANQDNLLRWLLGGRLWAVGWLLIAALGVGLAAALLLLRRPQRPRDRLSRELAGLLRVLERLRIRPEPGETLEALAARAGGSHPPLAEPLAELAACHGELRHGPKLNSRERRRISRRWQLALRRLKGSGSAL